MSATETPTRPFGAAGDRGEAGFALDEEVIGLHLAIGALLAIARYVDRDQAGMERAKRRRAEARPCRRAGGEILHEHVRRADHPPQQGGVGRILEVERDRLLAAVEPDEIGALAVHDMVVAAGEIALFALDLDHPRAGIGEAGGAERRGDRLLERDNRDPFERQGHQKLFGRPSTCVATWLRIKLVEIGAT
jgi:hypothetical protein